MTEDDPGMWEFITLLFNRYNEAITGAVPQLLQQMQGMKTTLEAIMATQQQFTDALTRVDTATTAAAGVLKELRDKVANLETNAGISATDEESVLKQLDAVAGALEQMAKTPENPVPVDPANPPA